MANKEKDDYLVELKIVLDRVQSACRASAGLGQDCEEFLNEFVQLTVAYNSEQETVLQQP